jgi:hypothetical protein
MEIERARYLAGAGKEVLSGLDAELVGMPLTRRLAVLRKTFPAGEAAALSEQIDLRAKAHARFAGWDGRLFTAEGLEMTTHPAVAARRARRVAAWELPVADLTCGIGGDLCALVEVAVEVMGADRDVATAMLAGSNSGAQVVVGDAARVPIAVERLAAVLDPSRRASRGRVFDPAAFSPAWDVCMAIAEAARAAVVKGPPGLPHGAVPETAEVEFVQFGRGMREATLWFGPDVQAGLRRAVLLSEGVEVDTTMPECPAETVGPAAFVLDPESCVTRAGLVRHLGEAVGGRLLDPQVAYLTADEVVASPLCAAFEVLDIVDFSVARLRKRLRERHWRPEEIRRRAFPVEPDELRRLLGRMEGDPVTLLCTTIGGERTIFVARRAGS